MEKGQLQFNQARFGEAVEAYTRATQISPSRAEGWCNLGAAQVEAGHCQSALVALQRSIALQPELMATHIALGDALRHLGRFSEATTAYREAVALRRTPLSLNKLACMLRNLSRPAEAEALYREALRMEPRFTIAQVNLATIQIELQRFDQAVQQLQKLVKMPLPAAELREAESALQALSVHQRVAPALNLLKRGESAALSTVLKTTPEHLLEVDDGILETIGRYAESANELPQLPRSGDDAVVLPGEWALIEALFMVPVVKSVSEYRQTAAELATRKALTGELLESINMKPVVEAVRAAQADLHDPIQAELHLRHWHVLASRGMLGFSPGQFKITRNLVRTNPSKRRAEPHLVSGTFRRFISEIYSSVTPGLPRAIVVWMAICDIHPFADGNGRIGLTWLNRELEWAGCMPTLFPRELGVTGNLGTATSKVHRGGDVSVLAPIIAEAQKNAREFSRKLASHS